MLAELERESLSWPSLNRWVTKTCNGDCVALSERVSFGLFDVD